MESNIINKTFELSNTNHNNNQTKLPNLEETYDLTLLQLVQKLNDIGGLKAIEIFFNTHAYSVSKHIPGVIGIKYIEGLNKLWKPKWSREARGRFYWIGLGSESNQTSNPINKSNQVIELKSALQRGIEVLTKAHIESGIEQTQDVEPKSLSVLDDKQREIIRLLGSANNPINTILTAKVDGSLIIVNFYPINCPQYPIIKNLIFNHASNFTKSLCAHCVDHNLPIITISTQGTLFIGLDMEDYFLTSIQSLISTPIEFVSDWDMVIPQFVSLCMEYYWELKLNMGLMCNICFEAYCANRTTITGKVHTELAVGYDHNGFNLLGMMYNTRYIPHFNMPKKIFKHPVHINIQSSGQVFDLMNKLDKIVLGELTLNDFLAETNCQPDDLTSNVIHPEGFVMLTPDSSNTYDYAKIKTQLYYRCHKVRSNNIKNLLLLPESCQVYYPVLKSMHLFFDNLENKLKGLITESLDALTLQINPNSELYQMQNIKAKARIDIVINSGISSTDPKQLDIVYKMLLNTKNSSDIMTKILGPITDKLYGSKAENIITYTKNLLMNVEPWAPNWINRYYKLYGSFDDSINQLFAIVVGFTD